MDAPPGAGHLSTKVLRCSGGTACADMALTCSQLAGEAEAVAWDRRESGSAVAAAGGCQLGGLPPATEAAARAVRFFERI